MPGSIISARLCSTFIYSRTKKENGTPASQLISGDVCKNIIRGVISQQKNVYGTVSTTRPVQRRLMRAAANYILRPAKVAERSGHDYKSICRSGASRNCTNRV